ncbi:F0F1 ATP synthase subunit A [Salinibacterium sp. dk2585]|uniref:F0F1 ATP synthase subunit A n=1 Tax=unclassified Salinibacterium TaxID=2632331 RepID=UPI0011C24EE9|nr:MULTISPECIES: F0F1 ATP synthase subunit A [unclassified Salinibacterium]QEE62648.1 F0F1 ATP synthase subunit A [Salinibacterium sp. dk2585]TXK54865.1 F0F1 ATP synthase subunit A [Salinibacterium sp. dk5596]
MLIPTASEGDGFHPPTLDEFFPPAFLFEGTPFEMNRIMLIRLLMTAVLILLFWLALRRARVVPGRGQSIVEMAMGFVRTNIAEDILGRDLGRRFFPLLAAIFFGIFFINIAGIIPGLNIAGTSVIGLPLLIGLVSYVAFIYAGIKEVGAGKFFKNALVPAGVPWPLYILLTPIEFINIFLVRPLSLALRLLLNFMVGHILLVLCFSATHFFFFTADGWFPLIGVGTLAAGFIMTLIELAVSVLQAYVFTLLTTVYIQQAVAEEH